MTEVRIGWVRILRALSLCLGVTLALTACGGNESGGVTPKVITEKSKQVDAIRILSNRPDLLSGGDALVEIVSSVGIDTQSIKVDVSGVDVTSEFAVRQNGRFQGLVKGLALGESVISARVGGGPAVSIKVKNHERGGRILYGPQIQPWGCDMGALDVDCNRPTIYI